MSDRGEDIKRQGWSSSRSSSGEGPDEVTANDESNQNESTGFSSTTIASQLAEPSSYPDSSAKTDTQELESSESRKLVAEADDLKSKLKELNIGSFEDASGLDG